MEFLSKADKEDKNEIFQILKEIKQLKEDGTGFWENNFTIKDVEYWLPDTYNITYNNKIIGFIVLSKNRPDYYLKDYGNNSTYLKMLSIKKEYRNVVTWQVFMYLKAFLSTQNSCLIFDCVNYNEKLIKTFNRFGANKIDTISIGDYNGYVYMISHKVCL